MNIISNIKFLVLFFVIVCCNNKTANHINISTQTRESMKNTLVKTTLVIKIENGLPMATLTFQNISKEKQYIDNFMGFLSGRIKNDLFSIQNSQNQEVEYIGTMSKMMSPTREDYHVLLPNDSVSTQLNLASAYNLQANTRSYKVFYSGYHGSPDDEKFSQELISNTVTFSY